MSAQHISNDQLLEQRLSLFQIARVEPFGEPAVDGSKQIASLIPLALIAPEPRHARCGAEFPGFHLLGTTTAIVCSKWRNITPALAY